MISIARLALIACLVWAGSAQSAPSISGVSGSGIDGNTITISGTGFGSHASCAGDTGLVCAWVRDWPGGAIEQGDWFIESNAASYSLNSSGQRPGHAYAIKKVYNGNRLGAYSYYMNATPNQWFVAFWFRLDFPDSQSGKFFRIYGDSPDNIYLSTGYEPSNDNTEIRGYSEADGISPPPSTLWGSPNSFGYGVWKRVNILVQQSPSSLFNVWMNQALQASITNWVPIPFSTNGHTLNLPNMIDDPASSGGADGAYWYSDMYVSQSQARVELCNASTWAACTEPEIQLPTSWSATSISATLNTVAIGSGTKYLYVCDNTGACNANGQAITIGAGGGSADLAGTPSAITTVTGQITTAIRPAGGSSAVSTVSGTLNTPASAQLQGSVSANSIVGGSAYIPLSAPALFERRAR